MATLSSDTVRIIPRKCIERREINCTHSNGVEASVNGVRSNTDHTERVIRAHGSMVLVLSKDTGVNIVTLYNYTYYVSNKDYIDYRRRYLQ